MSLLPRLAAACAAQWRRWQDPGSAADVETEYLRSLFRNHLSNSPACILATVFLYNIAPELPAGNATFYWAVCNVAYHALRMAVGLAYMRRGQPSARQLRYWGWLSVALQLIDGLLMLALALQIYPQLDPLAQCVLLMATLIIVGGTASSLAGHWLAIAVFAPPAYFGFAWASWFQDHIYAKPVSVLVVGLFVVYLFQAYNHRRSIGQAMDLAHRNGELARSHAELAGELQVKNQELQDVASERSRLLATVSHDLRQPSHAIGLLCERAMLDPNPVFVKEALADLHELSQSLSASLTTLMDLTRLDAGLVTAHLAPVPLHQVLLRVEAEFSGWARNKGLQLNVAQSSAWVRSDPVLLHGVLANLVSNAIKYTRTGRVDVEARLEGDQVVLSVRDTGKGIAPDKQALMFKEFVRLEGSESGTEGLGLGLSIVRRYAQLLDHTLTVSSQPGQGSCFGIALPAVAVGQPQAQVHAASRSVALHDERLVGLRLLVVDNVDLVLSSMVRTLSAWGCEVHAARSLAEARAVAQAQVLDLVISDFHLGDEEPDGLQLICSLRQMPHHAGRELSALLMTGDVSAQLEADAQRLQVGILHKPVRPSVLQDRVLNLLQPSLALGAAP